VHAPDATALFPRWAGRTVVTFQNGVASEAEATAAGCRVAGGVWRITCERTAPGVARFTRRGRVVVGRWSPGTDAVAAALGADLRRAGFDAAVSDDVAADKWLKLYCNLASAPNALVRPEDHRLAAFGALKAALLEEARGVFRAAGIRAVSCDGRDASLDEEVERQRAGGGRARAVHNSTWRALARGRRPPEAYHDEIVSRAAGAGVPAPCNAAMLRVLRALRPGDGPECFRAEELLSEVRGTSDGRTRTS
jgi:2-dehydropantoate 2-reductase